MPIIGRTDAASNSVIMAPAQFGKAPTTTNRDALYQNTTADAFVTNETIGMYAISEEEMNFASVLGLQSATPNNAGSGGSYVPGDTFTLANTDGVAFVDAVINVYSTKVRTVTATAASGTDYANGDTVTCNTGTMTTNAVFTVTTGTANTSIASLTLTTNGVFTTNPTLNASPLRTLTGNGSGGTANLTMGIVSVTVSNSGTYTTAPGNVTAHAPAANTSATGTGATFSLTFANREPEAKRAGMTGWAIRRQGTGGRAGRVSYELLVATGGAMTNSTADDTYLPQ